MKVCDIADWFVDDFANVVSNELHEIPRFHRKQWEFAKTFITLRDAGVLREDASGLSLGAGRELLLYAVANHVGHLWATDIYTPETEWSTARTSDIESFVKNYPPFPTRTDRISVKNMDMRRIDFPDDSFDFAYSSSAVEHIGDWDDFRQHLGEVRRVLKPGGIYVMTTDIIYGPAWEHRGNYKFTTEGLAWWLRESGMAFDPVVDCRIARHYGNMALPSDIMNVLTSDGRPTRLDLFGHLAHAQVLMGRYPHSSVILWMRKTPPTRQEISFPGYKETTAFLDETRTVWDRVSRSRLVPNPWGSVPTERMAESWGTTYMALGHRPRRVQVRIRTDGPGTVTLGVNRLHDDRPTDAVTDRSEKIASTTGDLELEFDIFAQSGWAYSIYGRALDGLRLDDVLVRILEPEHTTYEIRALGEAVEPISGSTDVKIEPTRDLAQTAYIALGGAPRRYKVRIQTSGAGSILLGLNRTHNERPGGAVIDIAEQTLQTNGGIEVGFTVLCHADWTYSFWVRSLNGLHLDAVIVQIGQPEDDYFERQAMNEIAVPSRGEVQEEGIRLLTRRLGRAVLRRLAMG